MTELARKHLDKLEEIKQNITSFRMYFEKNVKRYWEFYGLVCNTGLTDAQINKLNTVEKPAIEFSVLEAYISRLRGEFAKQEPGIKVRAADGVRVEQLTQEFLDTLDVIEAHLREIFFDASNDSLEYNIYSDLLIGGFSVVHLYTEYLNEMSFEQCIKVSRAFEPTMCFFDPLAQESHKGDGRYCGQIVPYTREEFEEMFGAELTKDMKFTRGVVGYDWSYINQDQEIALVAEYFEKQFKKVKIVKLTTGHTIIKDHYEELLEKWASRGFIEQPPQIVEERESLIESIHRYEICEVKVLSHSVTSYRYLPLVFVDGNSVKIRANTTGASEQMTRPYVYHAKGIQELKNFAGQTLAAEIENMVMHKFMACIEGIPEDYLDAYTNPQQASTLIYNAFDPENPDVALPPPSVIQRTPTPPIVEQAFMGSDSVTQTILGSYDSLLGINADQTSGVAIQQGAMQSNAAAIPYLMGYIKGLNRVAQIIIDMIPKYYVTPRSIPVRRPDGKRAYEIINDDKNPNSIYMNYNPNDLQVKVEAGVNSAVQKQVALDQIIRMMGSSELFARFINSRGLETLLDNMDIRGIEHLKAEAVEFMEELRQQEAAAAEQPNPIEIEAQALKEIEAMKVEQRAVEAEGKLAVQTAEVSVKKQQTEIDMLKLLAEIQAKGQQQQIEQEKVDAENARTAVEAAIDLATQERTVETV